MKYVTKPILILFACALVVSCQPKKSESANEEAEETKNEITASLEQLWETDTVLSTVESVLYDESNEVLYASCIGGVPPNAQDEDGFIAKVSPEDGTIIDLDWVTEIDAPKGMGLVDSILYVTNIDELVLIDITTGEITERVPVEGSEFLNDITVDGEGNVYFSDSNTNKVHKYSNGEVTLWAETEGGPNGLFHDGEKMMMATFGSGKFNEIDASSQEVTPVTDSIPGGDGVVKVGVDFLVSNWNGEVYYVTADYDKKKILDTKNVGDNAADIEFISSSNTLLVPTFFGNRIVAYKVTR